MKVKVKVKGRSCSCGRPRSSPSALQGGSASVIAALRRGFERGVTSQCIQGAKGAKRTSQIGRGGDGKWGDSIHGVWGVGEGGEAAR